MRFAWDGIRRRPGRSVVTALGIGLAVALVLLLLAVGAGISSSASYLALESGVDLIGVSPGAAPPSTQFPPIVSAHRLAPEIRSSDSSIESVSPWLLASLTFGNSSLWAAANLSSGGQAIPPGWSTTSGTSIGWIPDDNTGITTPLLVNGTGFTYPGDPHYANGTYTGPFTHEIVIDQGLATDLGVGPGAWIWASARSIAGPSEVEGWYANATAFRVVGITEPYYLIPTASLAMLYLSELQSLTGSASATADYASLLLIHLAPGASARTVQSVLADRFPGIGFFSINDILGSIQSELNLYSVFGELVGGTGLVVATLFTTTVLLMSVTDRRKEIAILRAIGYPRTTVGGFIVEESLLLAMGGLAIGLPLAYLLGVGLNRFLGGFLSGLPAGFTFIQFNPSVTAMGVLLVIALGLLGSIAPVIRAYLIPVSEELRSP
jgi:putative ABC transport system permease protein